MAIGSIVDLQPTRGFFFLRTDAGDFFAHKDDLPTGVRIEHLNLGEQFEFDPVPDAPRGPRAVALRRVGVRRRTLDDLLK